MNPLLTDKNQTIKDNDNGEINVLEENVIEPGNDLFIFIKYFFKEILK